MLYVKHNPDKVFGNSTDFERSDIKAHKTITAKRKIQNKSSKARNSAWKKR